MIYLGQPYTHESKSVRYLRYRQGMAAAAQLFTEGHVVYAPIVHWHEVASQHELPHDFAAWRKVNFEMIDLAAEFYALLLPHWRGSIGLRAEVGHAFYREKKVSIINIHQSRYELFPPLEVSKKFIGEFRTNGDYNQEPGVGFEIPSTVEQG